MEVFAAGRHAVCLVRRNRRKRAPATIFVEHQEDEANPSSVARSPVSLTSVFLPSADGETMISSISSRRALMALARLPGALNEAPRFDNFSSYTLRETGMEPYRLGCGRPCLELGP